MPNRSEYHLFTAADQPVTVMGSRDEFETRLVQGLLLEPGLVMTDTYFFSSEGLRKHIFRFDNNSSLFEEALRQGLIVPSLRQPGKNFIDVLNSLKSQALQGRFDTEVADRLSLACNLDKLQEKWPPHMGVGYDILTRLRLQRRKPSGVDDGIWELTKSLRYEAIDEARAVTLSRPEGEGLRRGEVIRVAGKILGVFDPEEAPLTDRVEILAAYERKVDRSSDRYRAAFEFFEWIDELHRINSAQSLNARESLFPHTRDTVAVVQGADDPDSQLATAKPDSNRLHMEIEIPSTQALLEKWSPSALLDEPRGYGTEWRSAAARFIEEPKDGTREDAEKSLEAFADRLRKTGGITDTSSFVKVQIKLVADANSPLLSVASSAAPSFDTDQTATAAAITGTYIASTDPAGFITYEFPPTPDEDRSTFRRSGLNVIQPNGAESP